MKYKSAINYLKPTNKLAREGEDGESEDRENKKVGYKYVFLLVTDGYIYVYLGEEKKKEKQIYR